jgi:hypothetical protein
MEACLGKTEARIGTDQESKEAKSKASLEGVKAMYLEVYPEKIGAVVAHQEVPNERATVESVRAWEDRSGDQQSTVGYQNPWKRRTRDDDVQETPKGPNFGNRHRAQPKCSNGKVNETFRQALILEIVNSWVFHQDSKNECQDIVEELATTKTEEETASSLRARDVEASATLGSFAHTDQKKKWP